ncbi:MAG: MGMT family protein [Candidatus Omnitrophica bacterium]|nr:MGMT family protein [Candidatus Omnitrophota bacterium]
MSSFAKQVYKAVLKIPIGEVRTYKWVAKEAGKADAYRAVGTILKNNPLPLIIPCHRVVKSNSDVGDYIFGKMRKKRLLGLEKEVAMCLANKK